MSIILILLFQLSYQAQQLESQPGGMGLEEVRMVLGTQGMQ
jgi:hypothetical protein